MLYLAEVIRKTRVIGAGRAEFKLLALQRSEQSWSPVQGEEIIPATDDVPYNAGVLVMLELTASKQIQRYTEAGRQLVGILQNFSRLQEKAKVQEEEIEQWKQSLTYQSQELNRREMEMELRLEELQQLEAELAGMEQQKQEIDSQREEVDRLRQEFERRSQELEGAWAQLHGEMNRLEEKTAELNQSTTLDAGQAAYLQELLNRLSTAVAPTDSIREQLNLSFDLIGQQQEQLNHYWQALDQHRSTAHETQAQVDRQSQEIHDRWQGWHQTQADLEQAKADLRAKQETLIVRQYYAQTLSQSLQGQEGLHHQLAQLAGSSEKVDLSQLENLPLDELQNVTNDLEKDLEKLSRFVSSQEEELSLQQSEIDQLKQQIQQASEYDRLRLETELADEQDRYQMLHETLIGQRRNLQERQAILKQHQMVLARRQGLPVNQEENYTANLEPVLQQITALRQQQAQELADLETQIQQLQQTIDSDQQTIDQRTQQQQQQREELAQLEQQLKSQMSSVGELWGKVNTYQESLQPIQDRLNGLREKAEAIAAMMTQFQEATDYQHQAIDEMRGAIDRLVNPQMEYAVP
ncbi:pilus motility taxis protein HmpF [Leptolyngbya ohadii]|uniref:pilus motility taxis protein HmpF n=1 Tax=Leptolyngbya ohadii TaxID=1962290 RepID=UPI000B5A1302|nr:pilus motility taxis protein HmpF [Leptolyngbya ohadii]